jgi:hypothetical protein
VLLSCVIFSSGGVVGVGGTLIAIRNGLLYRIHHTEEMPVRVAARLRQRLRLNDQQTRQVAEILRQRQTAFQDLWTRAQPEIDRVEQDIAAVLNDQQRVRWHRDVAHLRATWFPAGPPPRGDSPP